MNNRLPLRLYGVNLMPVITFCAFLHMVSVLKREIFHLKHTFVIARNFVYARYEGDSCCLFCKLWDQWKNLDQESVLAAPWLLLHIVLCVQLPEVKTRRLSGQGSVK